MTQPTFTHDCTACTFLGVHDGHDLYCCGSQLGFPTLVVRYGNAGREYSSGLEFARPWNGYRGGVGEGRHMPHPASARALRLACDRGLLDVQIYPISDAPFMQLNELDQLESPDWVEVSPEFYWEQIGCVPPIYCGEATLCGEPKRCTDEGAVHLALVQFNYRYFAKYVTRDLPRCTLVVDQLRVAIYGRGSAAKAN